MKGMILAAGYGERLKPQTDTLPKPLFKIGTTNMVRNSLGYLYTHGIKDIAINIHHLGDMIVKELSWGVRDKINLHVVEERTIMGTAGGIKGAENFLQGETFAVINSDILAEADLKAIQDFHEKKGALATLVIRDNPDPGSIGTLAPNEEGKLIRFLDTPSPDYQPSAALPQQKMFTGIAVYSPEFLKEIPAGRRVDISTEIFPKLMKSGAPIYTYNHEGYWADIGTPNTYSKARMDVALNRFKTWTL